MASSTYAAMPLLEAISLQKQSEICGDILLSALASLMEGGADCLPFLREIMKELETVIIGRCMHRESQLFVILKVWKEKRGEKATNRELIDILVKNGNVQLAQVVVRLLASESAPELALDILKGYLPKYYNMLFPPAMPAHPYEVPREYLWFFQFNKFNIPLVAQVQVGDTIHYVPLENSSEIFQSKQAALAILQGRAASTNREFNHLTIVQGVAGSGKSTMCWDMSKKWIEQHIFQDFPVFLYVSLSDPGVQFAKSIADFIPHPCEELRKAVADHISKTEGEGVALVVDGVDEAPLASGDLGSPFLEVLVDAILGWKKAAILITSRPCSRQLDILISCVDDYELVSMNGFTVQCAIAYLHACVENDHQKSVRMPLVLQDNWSLVALCQLPFNAFLASQLLRETNDFSNLPQTQTELVSAFLLLFVQKCTHHDLTVENICELVMTAGTDCFDWLPPGVKDGLKELGRVAIDLKDSGRAFVSTDGMPDSLSTTLFTDVMQGTISFDYMHAIDSLQQRQYRFPHLIIQDFFLAYSFQYLESEMVTQHLQEEMKQSALSPVLPFYAGLTGLHKLSCLNPLFQHLDPTLSCNPTTQALLTLLLFTIYETQSRHVLQYVLYQITLRHDPSSGPVTLELSSLPAYTPRFIYYALAYFVSNMSFDDKLFTLNLTNNNIHDKEFSFYVRLNSFTLLRKGKSKSVDVILLLGGNAVSDTSTLCNSMQLQEQQIIFSYISLRGNWNKGTTNIHESLCSLVEALSSFPSPRGLDISANNITSEHVKHIIAMLASSSSLQCLNISDNDIGGEFSSLATALSHNSILCCLSMSHCQLSDSALQLLGNALKSNQMLELLDISYNQAITARGLTVLLACLLSNNRLHFLYGINLPWQEDHNSYLEFIKRLRVTREIQTDLVVENSPSVNPTASFQMYSSLILRRNKFRQFSRGLCSFEHLERVVAEITSVETVVATMGAHLETLCQDSTEPPDVVARMFLLKEWRLKKATYADVIRTLYLSGENAVYDKLYSILTKASPREEHMLASCIVELYIKHPYFKRSLSKADFQYIFPSLFIGSSIEKTQVKMEEIIQPGKVVLVNGVTGIGKTTLLDANCFLWAIGTLHRDFNLVIKVPLDDLAIQRAKCLADLIPLPYDEICKAMSKYIERRKGKGVAFMLDAFDHVPPEILQSSYVANLLKGSSSTLPLAAVVVASQPGSTMPSPVKISVKLLLPFFTWSEVLLCLLKGGIDSPDIDSLWRDPAVKSLCAIPFFGCVIVDLLVSTASKVGIPHTKTILLKWYLNTKLVSFLKRHFPSHTPPEYTHDFQSLEDFRILPNKVYLMLKEMCRMAFQTLKDGYSVLGKEELQCVGISVPLISDFCSLGTVRVTQHNKTKYEFVHLIIQEFLAALHLASCSPSDVSDAAKLIVPFLSASFLFPFLSGLVDSHTDPQEMTNTLDSSLHEIVKTLPYGGYQHRLLLIFHCIYESRSIGWCEKVFRQLQVLEPGYGLKLSLGDIPLSLDDCVVIRCFYGLCLKKPVTVLIDLTACVCEEDGIKLLTEAAESRSSKSYSWLLLPGKASASPQDIIWKEISEYSLLVTCTTLLYGKRVGNLFQSTMNSLLMDVSPDHLSKVCSDVHLLGIANQIEEWKHLEPAFLTDKSDIYSIEEHFQTSEHQIFVMLRKWKDTNGDGATYHEIIRIFVTQGDLHLAGVVKQLLLTKPSREQVVDFFCHHLQSYYLQLPPPLLFETTPFNFIEPQLLFRITNCKQSRLDKVFEHAALDDLEFPISVAEIFKAGQIRTELASPPVNTNPIVILEGLAGSGKTTLVWYMIQKWAKREYYKEFQLLLYISSSDPMIHSANSLPDFIPHPSERVRNLVAKYIEEKQGEGVAFVIDDWSELPYETLPCIEKLRDNCLKGGPLEKATILVSSRSGICKTANVAISEFQKIILQGFSSTQVYEYLHDSLAAPSSLDQTLKDNPPFMALCQMPLYAAIASQMFEIFPDSPLPQTQTEMMKTFVLLRTKLFCEGGCKRIDLKSFADIPTRIEETVYEIGNMALFHHPITVVDMKTYPVFQPWISLTLGLKLMEVCKSANFGYLNKPLKFKFVHCTVEEFAQAYALLYQGFASGSSLLTVWMADWAPCKRVLQFYAGLSGLHTIIFLKPVIEAAKDLQLKNYRMWLLLIESIYEAQSSYLCQYAFCQLVPDESCPFLTFAQNLICLPDIPEMMSPITITAVSYFLSHIRSSNTIILDLSSTGLQDDGVSLLLHHMQKTYSRAPADIEEHKPIDLCLLLDGNSISHQGTIKLCKFIQHIPIISSIRLRGNWNPPRSHSGHTDIDAALNCIVETTSITRSLWLLDLSANNITPAHIHHLVAIVERTNALGTLYVMNNDIGTCGCLLAKALASNRCITTLSLGNSNIDDSVVAALGECLTSNQVMRTLDISLNPAVSFEAQSSFLNVLKQNTSMLTLCLTCSEAELVVLEKTVEEINDLVLRPKGTKFEIFNCLTSSDAEEVVKLLIRKSSDDLTFIKVNHAFSSVCSNDHLHQFSEDMESRETLALLLGSDDEVMRIKEMYPEEQKLWNYTALCKWKETQGNKATYQRLVSIFINSKEAKAKSKVHEVLLRPSLSLFPDISAFLRDCYLQPHSSGIITASADIMHNYVPLTLISNLIRDDHIVYEAITEADVLCPGQMVLIEGVAGSGKSTLVQYVGKKWAEGDLYSSYRLIVWVSLGDPDVQSAKSLKDLLPFPVENQKSAIADQIRANKGECIAFMFDGLDELPHDSKYILHFLKELHAYLPEAAVTILSRPGTLERLTSSHREWKTVHKVTLQGFSRSHVGTYFQKCLQEDPNARKRAHELISESHTLVDLCKVPFYAHIIACLLQFSTDDIPETRTGLLKSYFKFLLLNHIDARSSWDQPLDILPRDFHCLEHLQPFPVYDSIKKLCKLAFITLQNAKTVFGTEELNLAEISRVSECMGLVLSTSVHITQVGSGSEHVLQKAQFVHSVMHQFLAALYLTSVDIEEQSKSMLSLIEALPPLFSPAFLAGIVTAGDNNEACLTSLCTQLMTAYRHSVKHSSHSDTQERLLLLLECVFESQSSSIVKDIARGLSLDKEPNVGLKFDLSGSGFNMDETDFAAVGYFLSKLMSCLPAIPALIQVNSSDLNEADINVITRHYGKDPQCKLLLALTEDRVIHCSTFMPQPVFHTPTVVWYNLTSSASQTASMTIDSSLKQVLQALSNDCKPTHVLLLSLNTDPHTNIAIIQQQTRESTNATSSLPPIFWKELQDFS